MNDITEPLRLATGSYKAGSGKGCGMNVISWENGDKEITDYPECTARPLARLVQVVNDSICPHRDGDLLCPACSAVVLDLGHSTVGTAGASREEEAAWMAELLDSPEWGAIRFADASGREAVTRVADLYRQRASGDEPGTQEWQHAARAAAAASGAAARAAYAASYAANAASDAAAYAADAAAYAAAYAATAAARAAARAAAAASGAAARAANAAASGAAADAAASGAAAYAASGAAARAAARAAAAADAAASGAASGAAAYAATAAARAADAAAYAADAAAARAARLEYSRQAIAAWHRICLTSPASVSEETTREAVDRMLSKR